VALTVTAKFPDVEEQLFAILSETLPETAFDPQVVVILFVPCPVVIVTPVGTVHVYVNPVCATTL